MNGKQRLILFTTCLFLIPASFLATYVVLAQSSEPESSPEAPADPGSGDVSTADSYTVQPGDTLYRISRHTGISVDDLVVYNELADPSRIRVGQLLRLPAAAGREATAIPAEPAPMGDDLFYTVQRGDTLAKIAARYAVPLDRLVAANQIASPSLIFVGLVLRIPEGGEQPPPEPVESATPAPAGDQSIYVIQRGDTLFRIAQRLGVTTQSLVDLNQIANRALIYPGQALLVPQNALDTVAPVGAPAPAEAQPPADEPAQPAGSEEISFLWPVESRRIVNWYRSWHKGIDIVTATGSNVVAAAGGTVLYAGWHDAGYGRMVLIDHGNDRRSLYGHNSQLLVSTGQEVAQGELIALSGSTGNSTMPHVHLEIVLDDRTVDPCGVLPGGC